MLGAAPAVPNDECNLVSSVQLHGALGERYRLVILKGCVMQIRRELKLCQCLEDLGGCGSILVGEVLILLKQQNRWSAWMPKSGTAWHGADV